MNGTQRRPGRAHAALLVGLTVLLVGIGATAGHALWASSTSTSTNVQSATVAVTESGFDQLAGELTAQSPTRTAAVLVTNTGSTRASWTGTMTAPTSSTNDQYFARNVRVVAWTAVGSGCTANTSVGPDSATANWVVPPTLSGTLNPGACVIWCVRTTATAFPTAAAGVTATLTTVLGSGSWTGRDSSTAKQTTPAPTVTGGFSCQSTDGNWYVIVSWDVSGAPMDTWYGVIVNGKTIAMSQGSYGKATISGSQVPASLAADGTVKVRIDRLDANDQSVGQVAGGTIVAFTQSGARGFRCS
ncbi:hypothetical protein ACR8AL_12540 [Clavibacter sepedonicus]|uniref:Exported protein n=1 Tax=Clavibacter sepedonicus TaxID=31964 RepID=B0RFX7_CLASE|nr:MULTISPECIES: hypothetical protein [Clavibacter]MBD5382323.1 hypothetical protein [Clavibacter sp.]OQJ46872.1 hypothetical protein B5P19_00210 [Clavibacter sepedonicus]OQJ55060.1 hypothetical protein B5P20_13900 [Clavibacter sepedonicus]UUK64680.1 hypothetical protein LRE50_10300 [Clavibacter sepedonicus]CAQ01114.1 putative exported protein [Clavibacter sepedonicus]